MFSYCEAYSTGLICSISDCYFVLEVLLKLLSHTVMSFIVTVHQHSVSDGCCRSVSHLVSIYGLNTILTSTELLYQWSDVYTAKPAVDELLLCDFCVELNGGKKTAIAPDTMYCVDCRQHVCEKCDGIHTKLKTWAHLVIPVGDEMMMQLLYCCDYKVNI